MLSNIVVAGQNVDIQSVNKTDGREEQDELEERKIYKTKVLDILTEDQLEVLMPMERTKLILLPIDGEYDLCFYTKNGLYQCYAKVIDRYKSDNLYILVMELTSNLRKHQRREYYRFSCALEMNSRKLEMEEVKAVEKKQLHLVPGLPLKRSVIVDISGGGLRFIASQQYDAGCLIYCTYNLFIKGTPKKYNLVGKVLDSHEIENKKGMYEHRVQYINMKADVREEIIKYIFEEERKHRHNEAQ